MAAPASTRVSDDQLRECAAAGMTQAETARYLGLSEPRVHYRKQRLGLTFATIRAGMAGRLFGAMTEEERQDYARTKSRMGYTREETLRAMGRSDLLALAAEPRP